MRACVVFALLFLRGLLAAQEGTTFNVVHQNTAQGPAVGFAVKEVPSGYLVFSNQRGWDSTPQDPFATRFDTNGLFYQERDFREARYTNIGFPDPVASLSTGKFATGVSVFGWGEEMDSLFLYRFTSVGDTVLRQYLVSDTTFTIRKCIQTSNGDLLFTGLHEPPKEQYCLRTDISGNIQSWFAFPGFDGSGIAEDANGDIYLSGQWIYPNPRGSLIKCNSAGAVYWFQLQLLPPPGTGLFRTVKVLSDSSIFVCGYAIKFFNPFPPANMALCMRYSTSGELLWTDTARITTGSAMAEMVDAYQRSDGTIISAGYYFTQEVGGRGLVRAYDINGLVNWDREFTYYDTIAATGSHQIWDVEPTSDGGMILTGSAEHYGQIPLVNLWVIKLDSMGCLVPGCNVVGVEELVTDLQAHLVVSPNPARDIVNMLLELPQGGTVQGQVQMNLLDAEGRSLAQQEVEQNLNQLRATLDVSTLPSGTYYLHLRDGKRWLAGSKVVVE